MPQKCHPWRIGLPIERWPLDDRRTLEMALAPSGLFDEGGQARQLRPDTLKGYCAAWGRYLRFLIATDDLDLQAAMPDRLTVARLEAYLAFQEHLGLTLR